MKTTEKYSLLSFALGGAAAFGAWWLWPHAQWWVYLIIVLIVAGAFYTNFVKIAADEALVDGASSTSSKRKTSKQNKSVFGSSSSIETVEELLLHISDLGDGSPASSAQKAAVARLGLGEPPADILSDHADAILSAKTYAQAVADKVTKDYHVGREVSQRLIGFIIADRPLLERVMKWNERSFSRGGGDSVSPKKDEYWQRAFEEAKRIASDLS
jgi:hypothetical protein